ncbi:MAG: beta-lactamase family protein [Lachnospiraceae bacterium]|nr:beta-lactamase family protein [Lachnospiraceae bacterium]
MNTKLFNEYLNSLEDQGIPSIDVRIRKDHEEIYRYLKGDADPINGVKAGDDTKYLVFSMTKIQTMTALMQLVEAGKISLEDDVAKYLPAYGKLTMKTPDGGTAPCGPMLIKHLVSMQSGLNYDLERPGIVRVLKEYGKNATTRQIVDSFAETPLEFAPGTHFFYSLSHDVIAAVIEVVSGMRYGEYLKKNIWEPLGMKDTSFAKPMNDNDPLLARQYIWDDPSQKIIPMDSSCCYQLSDAYESGGAGLMSTSRDYSLLADALACGGTGSSGQRILSPESINVIRTDLLGPDSHKDIETTMGRQGYGYGVGMQILMDPAAIGSIAKPGVFGWDGAAGAATIMYPEEKLSLVFMIHVRNYGYSYGTIHPKVRDLLFA